MSVGAEPLSPELALVSPELARRARAALPERPWESIEPSDTSPFDTGAPSDGHADRAITRRRVVGAAAAVVALAVAATVGVQILVDRPAAPTPDPVAAVRAPSPAQPARATEPRPQLVPSAPAAVAAFYAGAVGATRPVPRPAAHRVQPRRTPARPVNHAVPGAGYVLDEGSRLQVAGDARSIESLRIAVPCFGRLLLTHLPVGPDGRFAVTRSAMGRTWPFSIGVHGAFSPNALRLRLDATGGGCPDRTVTAAGHTG